MSAPSVILKGKNTIVWGPGSLPNGNTGFGAAIIQSAKITPKNSAPIEIEDNNGFAAVEVLLVDGFNATLTCLYDSTVAWPIEGSNCAFNVAAATGNANANATAYTCLVVSQGQAYERKKEMMIDFNITYRPGVTV